MLHKAKWNLSGPFRYFVSCYLLLSIKIISNKVKKSLSVLYIADFINFSVNPFEEKQQCILILRVNEIPVQYNKELLKLNMGFCSHPLTETN